MLDRPTVVPDLLPLGVAERRLPAAIRVVIADDHRMVRSGLGLVLDAELDMQVVAVAGDNDTALRAVLGHKPDVLIMELTMPGDPSTIDALALVRDRCPTTATVVLSRLDEPEQARRCLRAGALSYVRKDGDDLELVEAVRRAARGQTYLNPSLGAQLAATPERSQGPPDDLSAREYEVLRLIALGNTNLEIGEQLFLSVRTVETHRSHVQQKLGRSTRAELVRYALDHDILH